MHRKTADFRWIFREDDEVVLPYYEEDERKRREKTRFAASSTYSHSANDTRDMYSVAKAAFDDETDEEIKAVLYEKYLRDTAENDIF